MNKPELVKAIADKTELSQKQVELSLNGFIDVVKETLAKGDNINLVGFGSFEVRERAARTGRNPSTGEEIQIAAAKIPAFKVGKGLKEAIPQPKEKPKAKPVAEKKKTTKK